MSPGVLCKRQLEKVLEDKLVYPFHLKPECDSSALDLQLGNKAWKISSSLRPSTRELEKIKRESTPIEPTSDSIGDFFDFQKGTIYLVQLNEHLNLLENISGRASGKSSIGRLDVITRLLTEKSREYDVVDAGYEGGLFLLLLPQTFSIRIAPGDSLNQLRLFSGPHWASVVHCDLIRHYGREFWHVPESGVANEYESWDKVLEDIGSSTSLDPTLFDLTVDLADPEYPYIYRARENIDTPIDLRSSFYTKMTGGGYDPQEFFEKIDIDQDNRSVTLESGHFYIMKSRERLAIPEDVAAEVIAISERIGDIRIHYAGFAHPGFGVNSNPPKKGTPLIFEVRATDMDTKLFHKSTLAKMQLFRMSEKSEPDSSVYGNQELKLSKVFRDWPEDSQ
jgi:dCTP deaminase